MRGAVGKKARVNPAPSTKTVSERYFSSGSTFDERSPATGAPAGLSSGAGLACGGRETPATVILLGSLHRGHAASKTSRPPISGDRSALANFIVAPQWRQGTPFCRNCSILAHSVTWGLLSSAMRIGNGVLQFEHSAL